MTLSSKDSVFPLHIFFLMYNVIVENMFFLALFQVLLFDMDVALLFGCDRLIACHFFVTDCPAKFSSSNLQCFIIGNTFLHA